jgi:hypothetical protein
MVHLVWRAQSQASMGLSHPTIDIHIEITTEHSACKETSLF